ncbi:uncharacterized protein LOC100495928 [Xenopus tropicalis]|uniref:Uncharacterized protein LOC100495928 n=1 Tax=Xenopus tropicalis TaxID=8364 RepID=A0A8J1J4G9_XENTR|nr:uncharacterized protein LOC100495928 [Xenopus tropicalis]XP_031752769.1 uncharacterized protein LOC100495928 [Xenopus tropicalis]
MFLSDLFWDDIQICLLYLEMFQSDLFGMVSRSACYIWKWSLVYRLADNLLAPSLKPMILSLSGLSGRYLDMRAIFKALKTICSDVCKMFVTDKIF